MAKKTTTTRSIMRVEVLKDIVSPKGLPTILAGSVMDVANDYGAKLLEGGFVKEIKFAEFNFKKQPPEFFAKKIAEEKGE
jgi:hypothetical protein